MQSDDLANKFLDHLDGTAYTYDGPIELAVFTSPPGPGGSGTEVTGGGYARETVTFAAASAGTIQASADVTFSPLHTGSAQTVLGWGLFDQTGNQLFARTIPPLTKAAGEDLTFPAAQIAVELDNQISEYLANKWLDLVLRNQAFASPAGLYLGVTTDAPTADGTFTEVSGGSYAREAVTIDSILFRTAACAAVSFDPLHTGTDQTIAGWILADASTAGNMLAFGAVADTDVVANTELSVPDLTFSA